MNWYKLHISFVAGDYEYALDLKKILRCLFLLLWLNRVKKYLSEIIKSE